MDKLNFNFKVVSFNVRGLNKQKKRRSIFKWIKQKSIDISLLQETYCTQKVENVWKNEWGGNIIFSNATNHSRGVAILIKPGVDVDLLDIIKDDIGRMVLVKLKIQDILFNIINIYAPNTEANQLDFYRQLKTKLINNIRSDENLLIGGDFNNYFNKRLDKKGGAQAESTKHGDIIDAIKDIMGIFNLNDIWRLKNPTKRRFTWRQKTPPIYCRLDFFLISDTLNDMVEDADILPGLRSDHSPVTLALSSIKDQPKGRGMWKLNNSFLEEDKYIQEITNELGVWKTECQDMDSRCKWEYLKYKIRQFSIKYGKEKSQGMKNKASELETRLKELEEVLDEAPTVQNNEELLKELNETKAKLEEIDTYQTEGLIMRSRCQWYEKGEKSNDYFLRLTNRNRIKKSMNKLQREDGSITTNQKEILELQAKFYETLYTSDKEKTRAETIAYLNELQIPELNEEEKITCEGALTMHECSAALKSFKNNKSPGNDGLTAEFYKKFWPILGKMCVSSFNESLELGELSISQRQAVITLLDKGKDRTLLKNWRPISLLNTDYKIASKAIANRFIDYLPKLIHHNQVGYIKGRNIAENIRAIDDLLYQTDKLNIPGLVICVDFKKAFDSIDWTFLEETLTRFNFGPSFIRWIHIFYNNISSCIINNGVTSRYFPLCRGVRQGDPLSPYLFILMAEILSNKIRQNNNIAGITFNNTEIKVMQYADDTTGILKDIKSAREFFKTLEEYGKLSGLKLNMEKTEGMWIGQNKHDKRKPLGISWAEAPIKILGIYMSYNEQKNNVLNFEEKIKKCKQIIHLWHTRNLTLQGRIQIIKTFIMSQFSYVTSVLIIPEKYQKQIDTMIFQFIWHNGNDRLKRKLMYKSIEKGGLKVPDIYSIVKTSRVMWLQKYISPTEHTWKTLFENALLSSNLRPDVLLGSNYDLKLCDDLNLVSQFYQETLVEWFKWNNGSNVDKNEILWYNKRVTINKKPVFYEELKEVGINTVGDLYNENKKAKPFAFWNNKGLGKSMFMKWRGLVSSTKKAMERNLIIVSAKTDRTTFDLEELTYFNIPLSLMTSRRIYNCLINKKCGEDVHTPRIAKLCDVGDTDWSVHYTVAQRIPIDTKTREFQFKFLHDLLANNYWLKKWNKAESDKCIFCGNSTENIRHLFWECVHTQTFWSDFNIKYGNMIGHINFSTVVCGSKEALACTLILMAKRYIYECRYTNVKPNIIVYNHKVHFIREIEFVIAKRQNNVTQYLDKWDTLATN